MTTASVAESRAAARKAATRDAIADALLDLLGEGHLRPTAREIAQRAGISVRSVYVHFDDLEDLFGVAARRAYARVSPMLERAPESGALRARTEGLVRRRVQLYTRLGSVGRATRLQAPFSPTLEGIVRDARRRSRHEIERVFASELDALLPERRTGVIAIVEVLTSAQSWETLHEMHRLPVTDAVDNIVNAVVATIEAAA